VAFDRKATAAAQKSTVKIRSKEQKRIYRDDARKERTGIAEFIVYFERAIAHHKIFKIKNPAPAGFIVYQHIYKTAL